MYSSIVYIKEPCRGNFHCLVTYAGWGQQKINMFVIAEGTNKKAGHVEG